MKKNKYGFMLVLLIALPLFAHANPTNIQLVDEVLNLKLEQPQLNYKSAGYLSGVDYALTPMYSLPQETVEVEKVKWYNTRAARISYVPVTFFALGAISWPYREDVREWRNRFIPDYHNAFDDVLQYLPIMAVYGLNWAGVEGKHGLKRTTVTWAMSLGMMGILVNGIKYTTKVMRPDGSSANAFPSGHTAMAFVSATMLHKEFGQYRSPLYSFFGYAAAGWTGTMRQMNNRHWVSDVLVGAGIGILTTEVAYILAEQIYDEKETNPIKKYEPKPFSDQKPSFLSVKIGFASPMGDLANSEEGAYTTNGFTAGFEGAYFFNRNIGIGGEMSITSFPINSDKIELLPEVAPYVELSSTGQGYELLTEAMGAAYYVLGPYGYVDLSQKFGILFNVAAGYSRGAEGQVLAKLSETAQEEIGLEELVISRYEPEDAFAWNTGGQLWYKLNDKIAIGAYTRFMFNKPKLNIYDIVDIDDNDEPIFEYTESSKFDFSHWSLGFSINAIL